MVEDVIKEILEQFGPKLWSTFVVLIATTFAMFSIKDMVEALINFIRSKVASIGEGSIIILDEKYYFIEKIYFTKVLLSNGDDKRIIPMDNWLKMNLVVPKYTNKVELKDLKVRAELSKHK